MKKIFVFAVLLFALFSADLAGAADFFDLCRNGTADQVRLALEAGADANARDGDGYTPLMLAVGGKRGVNKANPDPEVTRLLIHRGADVRAEFVDYTLEREKYSVNTMTALHWAVMRRPEVVLNLLEAGADVNARGFLIGTPLMIAVTKSEEHPETVPLLLQHGADVNVECRPLGTALSVALTMGGVAPEAVQILLDAGADVRYVDPFGATMLICAVRGVARDSRKILQMMIDAGIDVNAGDEEGATALMTAVRYDASPETLQILLDAGAWGRAVDKKGRTIWHYLAYRRGERPDDSEICGLLKKTGVGINVPDREGRTPLMIAAWLGTPEMVRLLVDQGADRWAKDPEGRIAYDYATEPGSRKYLRPSIVSILLLVLVCIFLPLLLCIWIAGRLVLGSSLSVRFMLLYALFFILIFFGMGALLRPLRGSASAVLLWLIGMFGLSSAFAVCFGRDPNINGRVSTGKACLISAMVMVSFLIVLMIVYAVAG